jgi:RNA polymerase sigma-70 factor (ECF subfamily)
MMLYIDDKNLVKQMLAGDEAAFHRFFDEYFARLYRFASIRLGDDPDSTREVVHLTMSKALRKLANYRGESQLFTWLCAICRNETTDWLRRHGRYREHIVLTEDFPEIRAAVDSFRAPQSGNPDALAQRAETIRLVQVALDRLPGHYGNALEWKYIEGYSVTEVAAKLGVGQEAAQSLLARARRAFAEAYRSLTVSTVQAPTDGLPL